MVLASSVSLPSNCRILRVIERSLKRWASLPSIGCSKTMVERYKLEIQEALGTLSIPALSPSPSLDETLNMDKRAPHLAPVGLRNTATASVSESGTSLPDLARGICRPLFLNFDTLACGRLIRRAFALHELPSLIEAIFSSKDEGNTIRCLTGDDAQTFVDVIDEVRSTPTHHCESMIEIDIDTFCRLGTGKARSSAMDPKDMSQIVVQDMWPPRAPSEGPEDPHLLRPNRLRVVQGWVRRCVEGETLRSRRRCEGHKNILKQRLTEDNWCRLLIMLFPRACVLTTPHVVVLQGGRNVESPPASEYPAADRGYDVRGSVCDDIRLDGERKHQRLREGTPGCQPVGTGGFFTQILTVFGSNSLMFIQLVGVARGLIYIHSQGMIHGDLKGVRPGG